MNEKTATGAAAWHERDWDLVIMGAGTTGLSAAAFAGARNGRVLLVDASPDLGGSLLVAHGQISAAGHQAAEGRGIHDTPEMHYEEALRISKGTIDKDLARLAIFNAAEAFDWLCDNGYDLVDGPPLVVERARTVHGRALLLGTGLGSPRSRCWSRPSRSRSRAAPWSTAFDADRRPAGGRRRHRDRRRHRGE